MASRRNPASRFNRRCLAIAGLWLATSVPIGIHFRPVVHDFQQFYVAGVIARTGEWESLYPIPEPMSLDNAGLRTHSLAKPGWRAISEARGVPDYTHFMLPPPSALLFIPLSFLTYRQAFWVWTAFLAACIWGVAWTSGRAHRHLTGEASRWEGILALLIAFSPMTARSIRIGNVSPAIALLFGVTLLALLRDRPLRGAAAIFLGSMLKYATLAIIPLVIALRRWKPLLGLAALGIASVSVTLAVAGPSIFVEFRESILPTLSRPSGYPGNQSLPGLLARVFGRPLSPSVGLILNLARMSTLGAVLLIVLRAPRELWRVPANIMAASGLLISWLFIFSPIAWEHWPVYFCPIWGWMIWESRRGGPWAWVAPLSLALMYLPAGILQVQGIATYRIVLKEPFNSSQLAGVALLFAMCLRRTTCLLRIPQALSVARKAGGARPPTQERWQAPLHGAKPAP